MSKRTTTSKQFCYPCLQNITVPTQQDIQCTKKNTLLIIQQITERNTQNAQMNIKLYKRVREAAHSRHTQPRTLITVTCSSSKAQPRPSAQTSGIKASQPRSRSNQDKPFNQTKKSRILPNQETYTCNFH